MRYFTMAVPERAPVVKYLQHHLPDLNVVWDRDRIGAKETLEVLLAQAEGDSIVLTEDDIVLTKNFVGKAEQAIAEHPDVLIQFHSRTKDDPIKGSRWRPGGGYYNNQALYLPKDWVSGVLAYLRSPEGREVETGAPDRAIAFWMERERLRYWNHCPTLAEHLEVVSMIDRRRSRFRGSTTFQDPELEMHPYPNLFGSRRK